MPDRSARSASDVAMQTLELASARNVPLSVGRPGQIGVEPLARGRFLMPEKGVLAVEELQVPGQRVALDRGSKVEAFFLLDGQLYQFKTTVLELDAPVRLNERKTVRAMKLAAPKAVEKGNRRQIYRQSFALAPTPVDVQVWPVPRSALTPEQLACITPPDQPGEFPDALAPIADEPLYDGSPAGSEFALVRVPDLTLPQLTGAMDGPPGWRGEVADASEFGLGLRVFNVIYSRFKVFMPVAVRFRLPGSKLPLEFLMEVRRVQPVKDTDARLGGLLLINSANPTEVRASKELAQFSLELQRARAKRLRDAA